MLRHLRSILYALVLAPALWVLTGVGFNHDLTTRGRGTFAVESVTGLLLLVLAGAAYAILVFAPISPAGPSLAGLVYLGIAVWALSAPGSHAGAFPPGVTKDGFDLSRPGYGLAALLAVPLICTALSARRWAKYEPPVLPIVGVIGRARGAAAVAGTPVAVLQTQVIGAPAPSGQSTTAIVVSADETVAVAPAPAADGDRTIALVVPADDDRTQLIRPVVDGDRTQVIRTGLVQPPGDRTEVVEPPVADPAPSIVGREQPNLADDPTTRLAPAGAAGGDEPTMANRSTVMNLERPPDEAADDTTRLDVPAPRRPTADED